MCLTLTYVNQQSFGFFGYWSSIKGRRLYQFLKGNRLPETNPSNRRESWLSDLWQALLLKGSLGWLKHICRIETDLRFRLLGHTAAGCRHSWDLGAHRERCTPKPRCKHRLSKPFPVIKSGFWTHSLWFSRINMLTYPGRFSICANGHNTL